MFKIKGTRKLEVLIIQSIIILLLLFSIIAEAIGYNRFTTALFNEYKDSAYKVGLTASALINADNIERYLDSNGNDEEYMLTKNRLKILTNKMDVSVIYVIKPDSDYKHYTNIFNIVNDNSGYEPWEIGTRKDTTNNEYENKYKKIMEDGLENATIIRIKKLNEGLPHITSLIPLKNSNGEVISILCVQRFMKELTSARKKYIIDVSLLTLALIIVSFILTLLFVRKQIVKPIVIVNNEANRFAKENTKMKKRLEKISKISEVESLALSINKIESDTIKYIDELTTATKEKERIGTELKLASSIQENSIPSIFPAYPDRTEFDLYASMTPAKEVGGDFYDLFLIDDNHLALVMADVSGKGVPAALFMMVSKILISENALSINNPAKVLTNVNDRICKNNKANMFITVWLGIIDISTGIMTVSNAGHEDPAIYRNNKTFDIYKNIRGIPVGAMEDYQYKNYEITFEKGDKLFLYTDGIPEANDEYGNMYGIDRMIECLNKNKNKNVKEIIENIKKNVDKYAENAIQFDDLTMLCFEYKNTKKGKKENEKKV